MNIKFHIAFIAIFSTVVAFSSSQIATAQNIRPDSTTNTLVDTPGCNICTITGGITQGSNLFHSFEEFSVLNGGEAFFDELLNVENIFARVTGDQLSEINGFISTNDASLMLMNPNGIAFRDNAALDIQGSFLATTADSIDFGSDGQFSVNSTQVPTLLTVTAPEGLDFGANPSAITIEPELAPFVDLTISPLGQTLALVGGELEIDAADLISIEGRIELGSVSGNSFVGITTDEQGWVLNYDQVQEFQDVLFFATNVGTNTDIEGDKGGPISVRGRSIFLEEESLIFSETFLSPQAGEPINIAASDELVIRDGSQILTTANESSDAGDIEISANNLTIENDSSIFSSASLSDEGAAGSINIRVDEGIELLDGLDGVGAILSEAELGNGGNVTIVAARLRAEGGSFVATSTFGNGNAGDLDLTITEAVELIGTGSEDGEDQSGLFTQVEGGEISRISGDAGELTLNTRQLTLIDGAQISTAARDDGKGGNLLINATEFVVIQGTAPEATPLAGSSGVFTSAEPDSTQAGGNLVINTRELVVEDGAKISADTLGEGLAGTATLNVERLIVRGGGLVRSGSLQGEGSLQPTGDGNTLSVNATESVEIFGAGSIGTDFVESEIVAAAEGTGDAGALNITTPSLIVRDGGNIRTDSAQTSGGQITITADIVQLIGDGDIRTEVAQGQGTGGDIVISGDGIVATGDSDILAFAREGSGGNITLSPFFSDDFSTSEEITDLASLDRLDGNNQVDVNATGQLASGNITFPDVSFIENSLSELPDAPIDTDTLVASSCIAPIAQGSGNLIITGADGIPQQPGSAGMATVATGTVRTLSEAAAATAEVSEGWEIGDHITEPQALFWVGDRRLVLSRECS